jgi:hypothetical protein
MEEFRNLDTVTSEGFLDAISHVDEIASVCAKVDISRVRGKALLEIGQPRRISPTLRGVMFGRLI